MKKSIFSLVFVSILCVVFGCISVFAADQVVYVSDGGTGDGTTAATPVGTLSAAYDMLGTSGGTVVVVGKITVADDFTEPEHSGVVTVTQLYGGTDYRTGDDYGINIAQTRYILNGDTTFKNIAFRGDTAKSYNHVLIVAQFNHIVIDEGVECLNYGNFSTIAHAASIVGGVQSGADKYNTVSTDLDSHITVKSGRFMICGYSRQVDKVFEGMAHIDISGGIIDNIYPGTANKGSGADTRITISGGTFVSKIITGTVSVVSSTLNIKVTGGDFSEFISADGTVAAGGTSILDVSEFADGDALAKKASNFTKIITEKGVVQTLVANDVFEYGTFKASNGITLPYRYYLPEGYENSAKNYPVFLYMHGNGSRGSDNTTQLTTNGAALNNEVLNSQYDCIMIAPQCAKSPREWVSNYAGSAAFANEIEIGVYENGDYLNAAVELLDYFLNTYRADTSRVYVTGSSNGGGATWSITARYPYVFAAAAPLAGCELYDGTDAIASRYAHQNIWTFHGDKDATLPVEATRAMVNSIKNAGGSIKYTEIAGGGHNIWSQAAKTEGLVDWIFSHENAQFDNTLRGVRNAVNTPVNLEWNEDVATFGAVSGANAYRLAVYVDGVATKVYETTETSQKVDFSELGVGDVTFTVKAIAGDLSKYVSSEESVQSSVYASDPTTTMDFDKNGVVEISDALAMLKETLNNKTYSLLSVIRVLKYLAQ